MFCGAQPTVATIIGSNGTKYPPVKLIKGPLQTGSITYVAAGISTVILDSPNREAILLMLSWDNSNEFVAASLVKPITFSAHLEGMLYAHTAAWRSLRENAAKLEEARIEVAFRMLEGEIAQDPIIPSEEDLHHPVVEAIWASCQKAAGIAMSKFQQLEPAGNSARAGGTGVGAELGPFIDLAAQGTEFVLIVRPESRF
jgi:hypothetical protein